MEGEGEASDVFTLGDIIPPIFKGLTFYAVDHSKETVKEMKALCVEYGGEWNTQMVDYLITRDQGTEQTAVFGKEVVTTRWVNDCVESKQLRPIEYFHRPWLLKPNHCKPLTGCVVCLSIFCGQEENYLAKLIIELGAVYQGPFARRTIPERNVQGCSHLVGKLPEGRKFEAAMKWKIPDGVRYPEGAFSLQPAVDTTSTMQSSPTSQTLHKKLDSHQKYQEGEKSPEQPAAAGKPHARAGRAQSPGQEEAASGAPEQAVESMTPTQIKKHYAEMAPDYMKTPETPYGSLFKKNPSPNTRKEWKKFATSVPKAFQNPEDGDLRRARRPPNESNDSEHNQSKDIFDSESPET